MNQVIIDKCIEDYKKFGSISTSYIQRKYKVSFREAEKIKEIVLNSCVLDLH